MNKIRRHWKLWLIAGAVTVAVLAVAGPYVYINHIREKPPAALSLDAAPAPQGTSSSTSTRDGVEGRWRVGGGSQAGYRVNEVLFGQNTTAVGRTGRVTGDLEISGTRAARGAVTVDLASVRSDSDQRDSQFRNRIMNTAQYPNAIFELTRPADFRAVPQVGRQVTVTVTGDLTIHGQTRPVTFDLTAQRTAGALRVSGSIPITFADHGVEAPNFGGITVEDAGTIEFLLTLVPA